MRFSDLKIDGFGAWHGLRLQELPPGITVIYGPNEAGKTTLLQFLRTALYGFSAQRRQRYLPPVNGGRPGGVLQLEAADGVYEVRRYADLPGAAQGEGDVEVIAPNGSRYGQPYLDQVLGGVDEAIFNNVFAVGLREIQELGSLQDTRAAEELYKLSSGLDRVSLFDVIRDLDLTRRQIVGDEKHESQLEKLAERKEFLLAEIQKRGDEGMRWAQLADLRNQMHQEIVGFESEAEKLERQTRITELALEIHGPWQERRRLDEQIAGLGVLTPVPATFIERLEEIHRTKERSQHQREQIAAQLLRTREEIKALAVNKAILKAAPKIEAIGEMQPWLVSLHSQIDRLTADLGPAEAELVSRFEKMGWKGSPSVSSAPQVTAKMVASLRSPARNIRRMSLRQKKALELRDSARAEVTELETQIKSIMGARGHTQLAVAMETVGANAAQLRRRLAAEDRLEQLLRHQADLEDEIRVRGRRQVLTPQALTLLGSVFIVGVMLVLSGLFGGTLFGLSLTASFSLSILGFVAISTAAGIKAVAEKSGEYRWISARSQLDRLVVQIENVVAERDELDRALPHGGGPLVSRLQSAEGELATLEELLPLDEKRRISAKTLQQAEARSTKVASDLREAYNEWKSKLRELGLPEALTPAQVKLLSGQSTHIGQMQSHLSTRRDELVERKRELETFSQRLLNVFQEVGLDPERDETHAQLRQLSGALNDQRKLHGRYRELREEYRRSRRRHHAIGRSLDAMRQERLGILQQLAVPDEAGMRERLKRIETAKQWEVRRDELVRQIRAALGTQGNEQEVAAELEKFDRDHLNKRCDQFRSRLREVQSAERERHERRGELSAEMKGLVEDRRAAEARLELACVEQQMADAEARWRTCAVAGRVLDCIRRSYESERQPEVLREASAFLERLTLGQYVRIWTPLGMQSLRVDDKQARTLSLDVLSCGTREAVFLSLRLALVAAYARRRGVSLPLVLDDVLVNLDLRRTEAAANVLREFSRAGHQMFVFTCHEHIVRIFKQLQVDIRTLPGVAEPVVEEVLVELPAPPPPARREEPKPAPLPAPAPVRIPEPVIHDPRPLLPVITEPPERVARPVRIPRKRTTRRIREPAEYVAHASPIVPPVREEVRYDPPFEPVLAPVRAPSLPEPSFQPVLAPIRGDIRPEVSFQPVLPPIRVDLPRDPPFQPVLPPVREDFARAPALEPLLPPVKEYDRELRIDPPHTVAARLEPFRPFLAPLVISSHVNALPSPNTVVHFVESPSLSTAVLSRPENPPRNEEQDRYEWSLKRYQKFSWDEPNLWWDDSDEEAA